MTRSFGRSKVSDLGRREDDAKFVASWQRKNIGGKQKLEIRSRHARLRYVEKRSSYEKKKL